MHVCMDVRVSACVYPYVYVCLRMYSSYASMYVLVCFLSATKYHISYRDAYLFLTTSNVPNYLHVRHNGNPHR